jgi:hypothetical protein
VDEDAAFGLAGQGAIRQALAPAAHGARLFLRFTTGRLSRWAGVGARYTASSRRTTRRVDCASSSDDRTEQAEEIWTRIDKATSMTLFDTPGWVRDEESLVSNVRQRVGIYEPFQKKFP